MNKRLLVDVLSVSSLCCVVFFAAIIPMLHRFLSKSKPVAANVLVMQGWIFDTMVDQAVAEINRGNYTKIIVTGSGHVVQSGRKKLFDRGVGAQKIEIAPFYAKKNSHRTFREAHSLKKFLQQHYPDVRSINVVTSSVHGKKTYTIFKKVLGDSINIGIITCRSNFYNQDRLWMSPLGVKVTLKFFIGYVYGLLWNSETGNTG